MTRKTLLNLLVASTVIVLTQCGVPTTATVSYPGTVYLRYLTEPEPSGGIAVQFNAPILRWPVEGGSEADYDVRLSQDSTFVSDNTLSREKIPWAMFNPHQSLAEGKWYWQYRISGKAWSALQCFEVVPESIALVSPPASRFLIGIPADRPRVLADKADVEYVRLLPANDDTRAIIHEAEAALRRPILTEQDGLPSAQFDDADRNRKMKQDASKRLGDFAYNTVIPLCQAYLLTGDERYQRQAIRIAQEVATWDPKGVSHFNDFSDARCMLALATVFDTFHESLTVSDRAAILQPIIDRATGFYTSWRNNIEARLLSGHVWQHILHYFFQTAIAVYGDAPESPQWLEYAYELFLARAPILGGVDGGWIEGASYFQMNMETLLDIPLTIKRYTGFDFIQTHPWYTNHIDWLIYHVPPGSSADGFGDNTEDLFLPGTAYIAYADMLARLTRSPKAAWYAEMCRQYEDPAISSDKSLRWIRLVRTKAVDMPKMSKVPELETGKAFREIGLAALHSNLTNIPRNLMVAMRSSPFGSYGHFLSDQNAFNIAYGGKRAFFRTGYKVTMKDPHRTGWYQHTKSNNSVLIDGAGQPYSTEAYGWIPRFLQGEEMAYAMGDASAAYTSVETDEDYGLTKFHRHLVLLKPDIIVVYDELEADHAASWSWLLHSMAEIQLDTTTNRFSSRFDGFDGVGKLWAPTDLSWSVVDTFEVPAENWRGSMNQHGELKMYDDEQWHLKAINVSKAHSMRFLAVLQIGPAAHADSIGGTYQNGVATVSIGDWNIRAQLDAALAPDMSIVNHGETTAFSTHAERLSLAGKTFGKNHNSAKLAEARSDHIRYVEASDELPYTMRQRILTHKKKEK